jgi:hypothetical protein
MKFITFYFEFGKTAKNPSCAAFSKSTRSVLGENSKLYFSHHFCIYFQIDSYQFEVLLGSRQ